MPTLVQIFRASCVVGILLMALFQMSRGSHAFMLQLGFVICAPFIVRLTGHKGLSNELWALAFVGCAIISSDYSFRVTLDLMGDTTLSIRPAGFLLAFGLLSAVLQKTSENKLENRKFFRKCFIFSLATLGFTFLAAYALLTKFYPLNALVLIDVAMHLMAALAAFVLVHRMCPLAGKSRIIEASGAQPGSCGTKNIHIFPLPKSSRASIQEQLAVFSACLAIAFVPLAYKFPLKFLALTPTDIFLLLTCVLLFPNALVAMRKGDLFAPLKIILPFLICAFLSIIGASFKGAAVREFVQLALYLCAGIWAFSCLAQRDIFVNDLRIALASALFLGITLGAIHLFNSSPTTQRMIGTSFGFACGLSILACIAVAAWNQKEKTFVLICILGIVAILVSVLLVSGTDLSAASKGGIDTPEPISQRYREFYASMSVLAKHPLFGVGIGNYQQHIGEYYQGMAKENAIILGTRVGYGVIIASTGLMGFIAFVYWLLRLLRESATLQQGKPAWQLAVVLGLSGAILTPVLVGQIMLPLGLLHALIWRGQCKE